MSQLRGPLQRVDGEGTLTQPAPDKTSVDRLSERTRETGARRDLDVSACESQALEWIGSWWNRAIADLDEPPPVRELVVDNAAHYAVWHQIGPSSGTQPGFLALHRFAMREARDVERGSEAASETWLDVRDRLEHTVARAAAGKSVPDFTGPTPIGEDNAHRYHGIQVRLRVAGKWSRQRSTEVYEEGRHASEWSAGFRAAEARTYALPLHFAAWWTLLDVRSRRTRDGREKGMAWWWSMLLHALDLEKIDALGGDRNDPTEALLRMRLRFSVSQGLAGWLRRWSAGHPYWSAVEFGLPEPDNERARAAAQEALDTVRPALIAAIDALHATEEERRALHGTLIRGENVRTSTRLVDGEDATERQARLFALGEEVGRSAADRLSGGAGGSVGGGGGGGGHVHVDALMARLATGSPPGMDEVATLRSAISSCPECRDRWAGVVDCDPYVGAATAEAPRSGRGWIAVGALALVATALLVVGPLAGTQAEIGLRGAEGAVPAHLDLLVSGASGVDRMRPGQALHVGDRLIFQLSSDQQAQTTVRVDGPEGAFVVGAEATGPEPTRLGDRGQGTVTTYAFERPGRYGFEASTEPVGADGTCRTPACVRTVVEVLP